MQLLRSHPHAASGAWVLLVLAFIALAWRDWNAPTGWEEAAAHIEAQAEPLDLIVLAPSWEARQVRLFEGRMVVAADGVLPREVRPWDRIWLVSEGEVPPGIAPLLRGFQTADEGAAQGVQWTLHTRSERRR